MTAACGLASGKASASHRVRDGVVTRHHTAEGISPAAPTGIVEDADGRIWIGASDGLRRLAGDRFVASTNEGLRSDDGVSGLNVDRAGQLLVATHSGVFRWQRDHFRFDGVAPATGVAHVLGIGEDTSGRIWVADNVTALRGIGRGPGHSSGRAWPRRAHPAGSPGRHLGIDDG